MLAKWPFARALGAQVSLVRYDSSLITSDNQISNIELLIVNRGEHNCLQRTLPHRFDRSMSQINRLSYAKQH